MFSWKRQNFEKEQEIFGEEILFVLQKKEIAPEEISMKIFFQWADGNHWI